MKLCLPVTPWPRHRSDVSLSCESVVPLSHRFILIVCCHSMKNMVSVFLVLFGRSQLFKVQKRWWSLSNIAKVNRDFYDRQYKYQLH